MSHLHVDVLATPFNYKRFFSFICSPRRGMFEFSINFRPGHKRVQNSRFALFRLEEKPFRQGDEWPHYKMSLECIKIVALAARPVFICVHAYVDCSSDYFPL
jgi:hypothetical protein